ncbi:MAG TPA: hypothetical protein VFZ78_12695 [Flavisolibacter sp.]
MKTSKYLILFAALFTLATRGIAQQPASGADILQGDDSTVHAQKMYPSRFYVSVGASFHKFKVKGNRQAIATLTDYDAETEPVIAAGVRIYSQKSNGRFYVAPQLSLFRYHAEGSIYRDFSGTTTTTFHADAIINPQFNAGYLVYRNAFLSWNVQAGAGIFFYIGHEEREDFESNTTPPWTRVTVSDELKPDRVHVHAGTGITIRERIGLWANFMTPVYVGSQASGFYSGVLTARQAGLTYFFSL